jgi:putative FmdB family regulatory protein
MPHFDFICTKCGHKFEKFLSIKSDHTYPCPKCNSVAEKIISGGMGVIFKGDGFYITENRSDEYKRKEKEEKVTSDK